MVLTENILIRKETMMQIQNINEESFKKYGKILTGYHVARNPGRNGAYAFNKRSRICFRLWKKWRLCLMQRR